MSNRPNRKPQQTRRATTAPDRSKVLIIAGAVLAVLVVLGVVIAMASGGDSQDDRPAFGPVAVEGSELADFTSTQSDPAVGTPAPVVGAMDPEGNQVIFGDDGDEPTLVVFLAHWCPHCQREVPVLVDMFEAGQLDDVRTVGVLTGTSAERPNFPPVAWLDDEGWTAEIALDDERSSAAGAYGLSDYPFMVVLDESGTVVARASGSQSADEVLALLAAAR